MHDNDELLAQLTTRLLAPRAADAPTPVARDPRGCPLSFAQQRLWFLDQLKPGSQEYLMPLTLHVQGHLNTDALEAAVSHVIARHEVLRTRLITDDTGQPRQIIGQPQPIHTHYGPADLTTPFNLATGPLLRLSIDNTGPDEHLVVLTMHHIIADGWSLSLLANEISEHYRATTENRPPNLPTLPLQYADYANWQRQWLTGPQLDTQLHYWRHHLANLEPLELPTDRPRPPIRTGTGTAITFTIAHHTTTALHTLTNNTGTTLFMALLATFQLVLSRWSGQHDIAVGTPIAGRNRAEIENLIGFFVNTLVMRTHIDPHTTFTDLLHHTKETALDAYAHQDLPFERLVEDLTPQRDLSRHPLFDVMFAIGDTASDDWHLPGAVCTPVKDSFTPAKFDLSMFVKQTETGLVGELVYSTDLFDESTARRLADHFTALLTAAVRTPQRPLSELRMVSDAEREYVLEAGAGPRSPVGDDFIPALVERIAQAEPDRVALVCGDTRLTYRELVAAANRLAHRLLAAGAGPDVPIAVCLERNALAIIAMLGILKAGSAYVPLDPAHPPQRLAQLLDDTAAPLLLSQQSLIGHLPATRAVVLPMDAAEPNAAAWPATAPAVTISGNDLAYIIYTSGSTGAPKGVQIEHRSFLTRMLGMRTEYGLVPGDRMLQFVSFSFDVSVEQIFIPLITGATIVMRGEEWEADTLIDLIRREQITVAGMPPAVWETILPRLPRPGVGFGGQLRLMCLGGAPIPPPLLAEWFRLVDVPILNAYGPTEITVTATTHLMSRPTDRVLIGKPVANTDVLVLDGHGQPVPVGVTGELFIGGPCVARGYLNQPELTEQRFVDPGEAGGGGRFYRTGDLVRWDATGSLEYLGRVDDQVKIRGFRIEVGEIEAAILDAPGVTGAVVGVHEDAHQGKRLVGYVVGGAVAEVRRHLLDRLPEFMVPSIFVPMDALPLTTNGKVDRRSLPAPDLDTLRPAETYLAPRNALEATLCAVWSDILGAERVGVHDNFFALGGHSLLATRLTALILQDTGCVVSVRDLFERPTVAGLADRMGHAAPADVAEPIPARGDTAPAVVSFSQERLWFLDQLNPGTASYIMPVAVRLRGELSVPLLESALTRVLARHSPLRTRMTMDADGALVAIVDEPREFRFEGRTLDSAPDLAEIATTPFDLAHEHPIRASLHRVGPHEHVLVLCLHHVAADGWSLGVLAREISEFYSAAVSGRAPVVASLPIQYADFAAWQRGWLAGPVLEDQLSYWRSALEGVEPLELPTDRPRPPQPSGTGATISFSVDEATTTGLRELAQAQGASLFMVLLAAFHLVLSRWSGQADVAVGTWTAGRQRPETENLVGLFLNLLVLRSRISSELTFDELLATVRETTLDAYAHQDLPFERLVEELKPTREMSRTPLFQAVLALQNMPETGWSLAGLTADPVAVEETSAAYELSCVAVEGDDGSLRCELVYAVDLFDEVTMQRLVGHFQTLLHAVSTHPDKPLAQLSMLTTDERNALHTWNNTHTTVPDLLLHELLDNHNGDPHATAIICGDQRLTFTELRHRSNQLAHHLQTLGAAPGTIVALCMHRSIDMAIALLAILKTGAAYTPLDPDHPHDRLAWLLHDTAAPLVLTQQHLTTRIPHGTHHTLTIDTLTTTLNTQPTTPPKTTTTPTDLAYVIYTSGSTGQPKGVQIHHHGIVSYLAGMQHLFPLTPNDAFLQATPLTFDVSVYEMFWPWHAGATVVLVEPEHHLDMTHYANLIDHHHITGLHLVPSLLQRFLDDTTTRPLPTLRYTFASGEHLPTTLTQQFHQHHHHHLINLYGATEVSVDTTYWHAHPGTPTSAGHPMPNQRVHILAPDGSEAPTGATGEICLAGNSLAHGYHNRPDLTTTHFTPHPAHPHTRIYHTGDLGRRHHNGTLTLIGRTDTQIKLHGTRIELAEIETHLRTHPAIKETTVQHHQHHLTAYYTHHHPTTPNDLRHHLAKTLPTTHLPTHYIPLDHLPLTPNGKIDTHQLPTPTHQPTHPHTTPRNPLEQAITTIWQTTLKHPNPISIHDNFFTLGGHSLLATRVISQMRSLTNVEIPVRQLFDTPTIAGLAEFVAHSLDVGPNDLPLVAVARDPRGCPLSFAQQRLWFLDQLKPGSQEYLMPLTLHVQGHLNTDALEAAVSHVIARHEVLRTRLITDDTGQPRQIIGQPQPIHTHYGPADLTTPFNLATGPLLRLSIDNTGPDEHLVVLTMHHIIADGWSLSLLANEISEHYRATTENRPPNLPTLPLQYADYANWQRQWLTGPQLDTQLHYWRHHLANLEPLELPTDRPRPPIRTGTGTAITFTIAHHTTTALHTLTNNTGTTLFMALLATFQLVLSRWSGQHDIAVGTPIAGRNRAEIENLIGFFVNTLVMRTHIDPHTTFTDLLHHTKETALDAYAHQDLPFERLVEDLTPQRDLSRHPLFDVMFVLQNNTGDEEWHLPGSSARFRSTARSAAKFDITLSLSEEPNGLEAELEYAVDLFDEVTMQRLVGHFQTLLHAVSTHPDKPLAQLSMLTTQERHQLLTEWNNTHQPVPDVLMHELLHFTDPHATAITHDNHQLTFGELDTRANQLAHHLQTLGATPDTLIALCTDRSPEMIIGLLAILRSGAAFTPLDPDHPHDRLAWLLHDTQAPIVLTTEHLHHRLPTGTHHLIRLDTDWPTITNHPTTPPKTTTTTTNLAYVIYTSGSTGHPKGVQIEHRGIVNYLHWATHHYPPHPHTTGTLLHSPATFDLTITSLFLPLIHNLPITISTHQPPFQTTALTTTSHTLIKATPSHLELLTQTTPHPHTPINIHNLVIGGEALTTSLATAIRAITTPHTTITNEYGATEGSVANVVFQIRGDADADWKALPATDLPVGKPIANTEAHVMTADGNLAPVGVVGEVLLGGVCLARGYVNRPELTAERFIKHPWSDDPQARLYRTGDLGRWRPDGNLEYLGRIDNQIKLRGYRIELGEIEATLRRHDHITEAVVIAREHAPGDKRLVAYLTTPTDSPTPTPEELHTFTTRTLPDYMTPTAFHILDHLPLTPNGKVDRHALPTLNTTTTTRPPHTYTPPRNDHERRIAEVWENVLGVESVGADDNFFTLGGDSLRAVRAVNLLRQCDIEIELQSIFRHQTVAALASALGTTAQPSSVTLVPLASAPEDKPTIFFVHPSGGGVASYALLAGRLAGEATVLAIDASDTDPVDDVSVMARAYLDRIVAHQPSGPYRLLGWSFGGLVALEIAHLLNESGYQVDLLTIVDSALAEGEVGGRLKETHDTVLSLSDKVARALADPSELPGPQFFNPEMERLNMPLELVDGGLAQFASLIAAELAHGIAGLDHKAQPAECPITFYEASEHTWPTRLWTSWRPLAPDIRVVSVTGDHHSIMRAPAVFDMAADLVEVIRAIPPASSLRERQ
ncbi:non-ribosomal peptide synthetase [Micromonospora sp. AKA38]|uniref:non-ribosomal peptide synthetase n=1 Tax=Micromonospora sp. AKA38 TaxID=2733861 RepID=UPI0022BEA33C|nr:non-ribosomal peptide synthetase [Micromonospora sp. AKA38]GHJ15492.1 hypothetical protein TPA0908_34870 [Micromonospora sp. AKA38]